MSKEKVKKILFIGKDHRKRRQETIMFPPKGFEFIPSQELKDMKKDYQLSNVLHFRFP